MPTWNQTLSEPRTRILLLALLVILTVAACPAGAQEAAPPPSQGVEFTSLANLPTAGLLARGSYEIDLRMYPDGGIGTFVTFGFLRALNVGFSYGAQNVVGYGRVEWNPNVEFAIKARLLSETMALPALAIGYASQGYGPWLADLQRYTVKSPGFYLVASRNFAFLGEMGLHAGANRSREDIDDNDLNFFGGIDKSLGPDVYLILEYDTALNDNDQEAVGYGNGYLNLGAKWAVSPRLRLELYFTNLLDNVRGDGKAATIQNIADRLGGAGREIRIVYVDWF